MSNSWNIKCWTVDLPKPGKLSSTVILKYRWVFFTFYCHSHSFELVHLFTCLWILHSDLEGAKVLQQRCLLTKQKAICSNGGFLPSNEESNGCSTVLSTALFKGIPQWQSLNMPHSSFHSWGCSSELFPRPVFRQSGEEVTVNCTALWAKTVVDWGLHLAEGMP